MVAVLEIADAIKKDSSKGPISLVLKQAFCGCMPEKSKVKEAQKDTDEKETDGTEIALTEKQNGENVV